MQCWMVYDQRTVPWEAQRPDLSPKACESKIERDQAVQCKEGTTVLIAQAGAITELCLNLIQASWSR